MAKKADFSNWSETQIVDKLVQAGLGPGEAAAQAQNIVYQRAQTKKKKAASNVTWGALLCVGGLVVTIGTLSAASSGGGTYVVWWGAILWGAVLFLSGLSQRGQADKDLTALNKRKQFSTEPLVSTPPISISEHVVDKEAVPSTWKKFSDLEKVTPHQTPQQNQCPSCGQLMEISWLACPYCAYELPEKV